jgi:hypothetical protein
MSQNDLASQYDALIQQIADLYAQDRELFACLRRLRVNREEWDSGRCGGHFYFEEMAEDSGTELVDVVAEDTDGAAIAVTLHLIGLGQNWAEWYRLDGEPVLRWPPPSVRAAE